MKELSARRRVLSLVSYFALAVAISYLVINKHPPGLQIGDLAPTDEIILTLDNQSKSIKSLQKNKLLVINFWATWCPPCRQELAIFASLAKKYANQVSFIGPVIDSPLEDTKKLLSLFQITYPIGTISKTTQEKFQAHMLPTTYLISPTGKIIWSQVGAISERDLSTAIGGALQ